jgi:hypothetical protein
MKDDINQGIPKPILTLIMKQKLVALPWLRTFKLALYLKHSQLQNILRTWYRNGVVNSLDT